MSLWRKSLADSDDAKNYLKNRGLKADTVNRFGLGYAPDAWGALRDGLAKEDVGLLVRAGLLRESSKTHEGVGGGESGKYYDYFRSRIMFPVFDERSRLCGFGGRVLNDDEPKYLNSPETTRFSKRRLLFGLAQAQEAARKKNRLLITEGYMDAIMLSQPVLRKAWRQWERRRQCNRWKRPCESPTISFLPLTEMKPAGEAVGKALEGLLPALADGTSAFFLFLPAGEDPDSFVRTHGAAAFEEKITTAPSLQKYLPDWLLQLTPDGSEEGKASAALKEGERLLRLINPSRAPYLKKLLTQHLAERFGVPQNTVLKAVSRPILRRGRAVYKMHPSSLLFKFLCCLATRPNLVKILQEDSIPLTGDDEAAKTVADVLSRLRWEEDVETRDIVRMLNSEGLESLAEQVHQSAKSLYLLSGSVGRGVLENEGLSLAERESLSIKSIKNRHSEGFLDSGEHCYDIEAEFHLFILALWKEYNIRTGSERRQWLDKIKKEAAKFPMAIK